MEYEVPDYAPDGREITTTMLLPNLRLIAKSDIGTIFQTTYSSMIMYIAGNHNTHWMVRAFLSQPFGTKKAYPCHATGTERSAQNLSAARPAHAIAFRSVPDEVVRVAVTVT